MEKMANGRPEKLAETVLLQARMHLCYLSFPVSFTMTTCLLGIIIIIVRDRSYEF